MNNPSQIRVMIADDHDIYLEGLRATLQKHEGICVVGDAVNGRELIAKAEDLLPDIILTEIVMPVMDGIDATRYLSNRLPAINVIALSTYDEDNFIVDMLEAGAKGYLLKDADKSEIIEAICSVNRNIPYYCKSTSSKLIRLLANSTYSPHPRGKMHLFSAREMDIIQLICQDLTNREIGLRLFMSSRTVEGYRAKIIEKMHVKTSAGIAIFAVKNGMFKLGNPVQYS